MWCAERQGVQQDDEGYQGGRVWRFGSGHTLWNLQSLERTPSWTTCASRQETPAWFSGDGVQPDEGRDRAGETRKLPHRHLTGGHWTHVGLESTVLVGEPGSWWWKSSHVEHTNGPGHLRQGPCLYGRPGPVRLRGRDHQANHLRSWTYEPVRHWWQTMRTWDQGIQTPWWQDISRKAWELGGKMES